jgi:hypothetical protein
MAFISSKPVLILDPICSGPAFTEDSLFPRRPSVVSQRVTLIFTGPWPISFLDWPPASLERPPSLRGSPSFSRDRHLSFHDGFHKLLSSFSWPVGVLIFVPFLQYADVSIQRTFQINSINPIQLIRLLTPDVMCLITRHGSGLVAGFIRLLKLATTENYSAIANSHTLQLTIACTKSSISSLDVAWKRTSTVPSASLLTSLPGGYHLTIAAQLATHSSQSRSYFMIDSQSASLPCWQDPSGAQDQIFVTVSCGFVVVGRPLWRGQVCHL